MLFTGQDDMDENVVISSTRFSPAFDCNLAQTQMKAGTPRAPRSSVVALHELLTDLDHYQMIFPSFELHGFRTPRSSRSLQLINQPSIFRSTSPQKYNNNMPTGP